jgi:hypothetical protein
VGELFVRGKEAAMTTFDLAEVRDFTADIGSRMDGCDIGDGMECTKLTVILRRYADVCREFCDRVRQWGDAVFAGRVEYDPEVEQLWREQGTWLHSQATWAWQCGQNGEGPCHDLEGQTELRVAIDDLDRLLRLWVTPKLAVGPAAKRWRDPDQAPTEEGRRRVAALPPLPPDWEPEDPEQRARFQRLRKS